MRICFLLFGPQSHGLANAMIASVRAHMPKAIVTHLTDKATRAVAAADEVRRIEGATYPYLLCRHMEQLPPPFIRLDYDMLIQGDLSHILDEDIDMALNLHGDEDILNSRFGKDYPYATCVWGAKEKSAEFARDFRQVHVQSGRDEWLGLIPSVNEVIKSGKYRIKALPGEIYNYTPKSRDDRPKEPLVVHYKGMRKKWMLPAGEEHSLAYDEARLCAMIRKSK